MPALTAKRPNTDVETVAAQPPTDEQELRRRCRELELQLGVVDAEIRQLEAERDAAEAIAESVKARGGNSISLWRAEESHDAAVTRYEELVAQRGPISEQYHRLAGYLRPIDRERDELDVTRRALAGWEKLAEVIPLLDQIAAAVEAAEKAGQDSRGEFAVPQALRYLVRQLGPKATGMGRLRVESAIRTHVQGKRERLARLTGGAQ